MFSVNSYAKIKSITETKEKYTVGKISTSQKNKVTNKYETDFVATVRFVGNAHLQRPMEGQRIKILNCGVSNCYTKDDTLEFPKNPTYTIFGYELQDSNGASPTPTTVPSFEVDGETLPF
jgi:hypothetical protein